MKKKRIYCVSIKEYGENCKIKIKWEIITIIMKIRWTVWKFQKLNKKGFIWILC